MGGHGSTILLWGESRGGSGTAAGINKALNMSRPSSLTSRRSPGSSWDNIRAFNEGDDDDDDDDDDDRLNDEDIVLTYHGLLWSPL